jgi:hypothetical protein
MTIRKLDSQLEQVDRAFAWILMRRFVISAGLGCVLGFCTLLPRRREASYYNHVIPSQPIAKKLLKTNRNTVAVTP